MSASGSGLLPKPSSRLRSACDSCSVAKVKCDKKQPVCDRCRDNGFTCSYSPSRRHGKHPWAKKAAELGLTPLSPPITTASSLISNAGEPVASVQSVNENSDELVTNDPSTFVSFGTPGPRERDESNFLSPWWITEMDTEINWNTPTYTPMTNDPATSQNSYGIEIETGKSSTSNSIWNADSLSAMTTSASNVSTAPTSSITSKAPQSSIHDCEGKGFAALHSLHSCAMIHTDQPNSYTQNSTGINDGDASDVKNMPSLDKILYFNRVAISTVKELLGCSCAQHSHIALLCMTISTKAIYWYRLAVSSRYQLFMSQLRQPSGSPPSCNSHNGLTSPPNILNDRVVKSLPIQIGVFDLEEEDQKLLMRGVLLREVRKLEGIVDKMQTLSGGYTRDDDGDDEAHMVNWYRIAGGKMKVEVQLTLKDIKEFATGGARADG